MKKFVCSVFGYVYEGEAAPEKCPVCNAPHAVWLQTLQYRTENSRSDF